MAIRRCLSFVTPTPIDLDALAKQIIPLLPPPWQVVSEATTTRGYGSEGTPATAKPKRLIISRPGDAREQSLGCRISGPDEGLTEEDLAAISFKPVALLTFAFPIDQTDLVLALLPALKTIGGWAQCRTPLMPVADLFARSDLRKLLTEVPKFGGARD